MSSATKNINKLEKICLLRVHDLLCGMDVSDVLEISIDTSTTKVYGAADWVKGVANLRGHIVTILDLRRRFSLPEAEDSTTGQIVIFEFRNEKVGFLVDEVESVINTTEACFEEATNNVRGVNKRFFSGIYKEPDCLIAILDMQGILEDAIGENR